MSTNVGGGFSQILLADTKYPYNTSGKRPDLPSNFTALVLPRRKALGVKLKQVFSVERDLHSYVVPADGFAAHAAGFAVSGPNPCCAVWPASGKSAVMNGVSGTLSEHGFV